MESWISFTLYGNGIAKRAIVDDIKISTKLNTLPNFMRRNVTNNRCCVFGLFQPNTEIRSNILSFES